jgi:two-component system, cell cycle sensor histidine kinase PleC
LTSGIILNSAQQSPSEARLELVERLLGCEAPEPCAQAAVEWLAHHTRTRASACLAAMPEHPQRLSVLASHGPARAQWAGLELDDTAHPLAQVLGCHQPGWFPAGCGQPTLPLGQEGFFAVPLGRQASARVGLLLAALPGPELPADVAWLACCLGAQLSRLYESRLLQRLQALSSEFESRLQAVTTELAEQNERLRRQALQLEQACAARSQFLANVSHELRTPLNAMLGYTRMLLQGVSGELNPSQHRSVDRIDSNGRHLLQLINDILDITRIEAGRMPLHLGRFPLPALLREVLAELEPLIARSRLVVSVALAPGLPRLYSDRQKIKRIIINLLSNALKFTPQGSVRVCAEYHPAPGSFTVSVEDTGIGIRPEDQERIFEDFQQVDSSPTRAYGGTGLGLSISRRLAHMLEGRLTLHSAPGQGSTFTLHLPRRMRRP